MSKSRLNFPLEYFPFIISKDAAKLILNLFRILIFFFETVFLSHALVFLFGARQRNNYRFYTHFLHNTNHIFLYNLAAHADYFLNYALDTNESWENKI